MSKYNQKHRHTQVEFFQLTQAMQTHKEQIVKLQGFKALATFLTATTSIPTTERQAAQLAGLCNITIQDPPANKQGPLYSVMQRIKALEQTVAEQKQVIERLCRQLLHLGAELGMKEISASVSLVNGTHQPSR